MTVPKTPGFSRVIVPPSTPPPSSALHSALINPSGFCSATRFSKAEAETETETDRGRGERGSEKGERETWLARFVDRVVTRFECPTERNSYHSFCGRYPERILEEAYARVCETPRERIRKSRGALFVYLVKALSQKK